MINLTTLESEPSKFVVAPQQVASLFMLRRQINAASGHSHYRHTVQGCGECCMWFYDTARLHLARLCLKADRCTAVRAFQLCGHENSFKLKKDERGK